ncbi:GGDEF domain-containing protein [Geitlerinema sp. P-1104]|uniref:GGDEF domain-containing protein n=1 Tax=Geitlerinema sp. P-1104 TaxID=2546230 RepID=UPI001476890F|nr:GGDEF domain-containing protein [Geitlerinema sp. P-1104]NMG58795.1 GGDEF domain-containing protein [Geitlerinema sp. P-1104]
MVFLLSLDPETMLIMIVVSAFLQAGILVALDLVANQYKGIFLYMLASILYALGMGVGLLPITVELGILQFLGNCFVITSRVIIAIAICQFLGRRNNPTFWGLIVATLIFTQYNYIFVNNSYTARNIWLIVVNVIIYGTLIKSILQSKTNGFLLTSCLIITISGVEILFSLTRGLLLLDGQSRSAIDVSLANNFSWLVLFFIDFLRNSFFVLMVSQRMYSELKEFSEIDFLTQILNRGALTSRIETNLKNPTIYPISLILLDIDYFKKINDTYGHDVGDIVLKFVISELQAHLHSRDIIGRWGGEEFLIFLPHCSAAAVRDRAELLRHTVENIGIPYSTKTDDQLHCTVSLGVVTTAHPKVTLDDLLKSADIALYQAKEEGRNRVKYSTFEQ